MSEDLISFFADLHIHIGRTHRNKPLKITAAHDLTFSRILHEAAVRKGLDLIGIIDAHAPEVQEEIEQKLQAGTFHEHPDGGIVYQQTTCLLGVEIEIKEAMMHTPAHFLAYLPTLSHMKRFTTWLSQYMKNVNLSTQRLYQPAESLLEKVEELEGVLLPAHIFTPFRSVLGSATNQLHDILPVERLLAVELGLSADSQMADQISELSPLTFLTNSDAHSLGKIAREYQQIKLAEPSFLEWKKALQRQCGRKIVANYGLNPQLGKYYRTRCSQCQHIWRPTQTRCAQCGATKPVKGVWERIAELADQKSHSPMHRPPYRYQVPLEFFPTIGPKKRDKLINQWGSEMAVLHYAPVGEIVSLVGVQVAEMIGQARRGTLSFQEGGAGVYGKVQTKKKTDM